MGYTTSTVHGIEVPDSSEANDVPEDIGKVVTALEGGSIVRRLTSAAIAALTAPEKPAGLVVYNTTTGMLQVSDGTDFYDVIDASGGTMAAALAMGSNKITGLTKGTATGDAVARQQIQSGTTSAIASGGSAAITFSPAFASAPVVVATPMNNLGLDSRWAVNPVSTSGATISQTNADSYNSAFMWIAVGN